MAKLTRAERRNLPSSAFALPETRELPIDTKSRARASLARAKQFYSRADQEHVIKMVRKRYPSIDVEMRAGKPTVGLHHENPTWIIGTPRAEKIIQASTKEEAVKKAERLGIEVESVSRFTNPDYTVPHYKGWLRPGEFYMNPMLEQDVPIANTPWINERYTNGYISNGQASRQAEYHNNPDFEYYRSRMDAVDKGSTKSSVQRYIKQLLKKADRDRDLDDEDYDNLYWQGQAIAEEHNNPDRTHHYIFGAAVALAVLYFWHRQHK